VAELLDAIELFEVEVERQGGDLMVNQIGTSQPQDSAFVPPAREAGEPLGRYLARINEKYIRLQERRL
jgi:hypothetical protein